MEEFNTLEKVIALFKSVDGYGANNTIFVVSNNWLLFFLFKR